MLIAGTFTQVGTQPRNGWARLGADGALDTGYAGVQPFLSLSTAARGSEIHALPDGRALRTGPTVIFSLSPLLQRAGVLMLDPNGGGDAAIHISISDASGAQLVAGGRFLAYGSFSTAGAVVRHGLARVDAMEARDASFQAPVADAVFGVPPAFADPAGQIVHASANALSTRVFRSGADGRRRPTSAAGPPTCQPDLDRRDIPGPGRHRARSELFPGIPGGPGTGRLVFRVRAGGWHGFRRDLVACGGLGGAGLLPGCGGSASGTLRLETRGG